MRIAAFALVLALPAVADAGPITAGAGLGRIQSESNADGDASSTYQLFGRFGFTSRLGAQLELQKIEDPSVDVRGATALLVVELGNQNGRFVPLLVAGYGFDHAATRDGNHEAEGTHTEGGLGLEYRGDGGLTIGADVRLGGRSVEDTTKACPAEYCDGTVALFEASMLAEGEYRSARLYAAIRF